MENLKQLSKNIMDKKAIWQAVLGEIELSISKAHFVTWFNNTFISSINPEEGIAIVSVPNGFSKEWLENKYGKFIRDCISRQCGQSLKIHYQIASREANQPLPPAPQAVAPSQTANPTENTPPQVAPTNTSNINSRYTFQTLIVGSHNELARAACESVASNPGQNYNPLFIYGGVGLGKTHLLQAIGNHILQSQPHLKVMYVTSEKFTTELVDSIKRQNIESFKNKYRQIDALLIDDIQFIGGKEKTQEEFFHIFNALYQENKQIVLCSDRPPKSIATLEERLRSRFEGGMMVDVIRPELETRIAILEEKVRNSALPSIEKEAVAYIAQNITSNVRELEGTLNRFIAACQLRGLSGSLEDAKEILGGAFSLPSKDLLTPSRIIKKVAEFYDIKEDYITGKRRGSDVIKPRQIAIYLIRKETRLSYPSIGKEFGGRDHTTIIHAFKKIKNDLPLNPRLKQELLTLKEYCSG